MLYFAISTFIFCFICAIFFISAGYVLYKKKNDINEFYAGCVFCVISLTGCLVSGLGIYTNI